MWDAGDNNASETKQQELPKTVVKTPASKSRAAQKIGPSSKQALFDSDSEDGGATLPSVELKINKDYARRFEHNSKRKELERCMCALSLAVRSGSNIE
jgi:hypothetical protein